MEVDPQESSGRIVPPSLGSCQLHTFTGSKLTVCANFLEREICMLQSLRTANWHHWLYTSAIDTCYSKRQRESDGIRQRERERQGRHNCMDLGAGTRNFQASVAEESKLNSPVCCCIWPQHIKTERDREGRRERERQERCNSVGLGSVASPQLTTAVVGVTVEGRKTRNSPPKLLPTPNPVGVPRSQSKI